MTSKFELFTFVFVIRYKYVNIAKKGLPHNIFNFRFFSTKQIKGYTISGE